MSDTEKTSLEIYEAERAAVELDHRRRDGGFDPIAYAADADPLWVEHLKRTNQYVAPTAQEGDVAEEAPAESGDEPPAESETVADTPPQRYEDLKVDELREELSVRDLPTEGKKDELIARLREDDAASAD